MAHVTRIKAKDRNVDEDAKHKKKKPIPKKPEASKRIKTEKAESEKMRAEKTKSQKTEKPLKKQATGKTKNPKKPMPTPVKIITWPFRMLAKPFIALGRYIKASWREIRQVRWPSRGATWKMVIAILIYAAIFLTFILLLDMLFTFIFNNILSA